MNMKNETGGEERFRKEKAKGRKLRQSQWWKEKLAKGICHYCGGRFDPAQLTMDHIVPIARGGKSAKGNVVPSCKKCNTTKKYYTPAEIILREKMGKDVKF
ncbi:HNH endonuclease [Candidatus Nitromaritima sp. SCGC AAA799-A02]|nr:HNH endonuclease [Candidatus Nitromaritima sp. SCGC AAA799-A02]